MEMKKYLCSGFCLDSERKREGINNWASEGQTTPLMSENCVHHRFPEPNVVSSYTLSQWNSLKSKDTWFAMKQRKDANLYIVVTGNGKYLIFFFDKWLNWQNFSGLFAVILYETSMNSNFPSHMVHKAH